MYVTLDDETDVGADLTSEMIGCPSDVTQPASKSELRKRRAPSLWGFFDIGTLTEYWCPPR